MCAQAGDHQESGPQWEVGEMRGYFTQMVPSPLPLSLDRQDGCNIPATPGKYNKGEIFATVIDSKENKL